MVGWGCPICAGGIKDLPGGVQNCWIEKGMGGQLRSPLRSGGRQQALGVSRCGHTHVGERAGSNGIRSWSVVRGEIVYSDSYRLIERARPADPSAGRAPDREGVDLLARPAPCVAVLRSGDVVSVPKD